MLFGIYIMTFSETDILYTRTVASHIEIIVVIYVHTTYIYIYV